MKEGCERDRKTRAKPSSPLLSLPVASRFVFFFLTTLYPAPFLSTVFPSGLLVAQALSQGLSRYPVGWRKPRYTLGYTQHRSTSVQTRVGLTWVYCMSNVGQLYVVVRLNFSPVYDTKRVVYEGVSQSPPSFYDRLLPNPCLLMTY